MWLMALSVLPVVVTLMATTYVTCWGSLLWFWITQGPSATTMPYTCANVPTPPILHPHSSHKTTAWFWLPYRHIIHYIMLLLIIGGATEQKANNPTTAYTPSDRNRTTKRRTMMQHRRAQLPPWSIHLLPWQLCLLSLLLSHYHAHSQPPPTNSNPHSPYPRLTATTNAISPSHTMWDLARRLLLLRNGIHPLPGPNRHHTFRALPLNVGGPHLSKKRWNRGWP